MYIIFCIIYIYIYIIITHAYALYIGMHRCAGFRVFFTYFFVYSFFPYLFAKEIISRKVMRDDGHL